MHDAVILTDKLSKRYGMADTLALKDLSLKVSGGEVYGFLGANGAGKSTTIRLLLNFLQPTGGSATILGLDSVNQSVEVKRHVGYLSGDVALYQKATGRELLDYLAKLQGTVDKKYREDIEKRFEAELDKPIQSLSKGNRQKLGIIQALMHQPEVLIMDEPTSGLDPLMQEAFYDSLLEAKARGTAVLMSSHNLAEAQRVCNRIGIIKHGILVHEQTLGDDTELGKPTFRVILSKPTDIAKVRAAKQLHVVSQEGSTTVIVQPKATIAEALQALGHFDIKDLKTQQLDLEDEFIGMYGDNV